MTTEEQLNKAKALIKSKQYDDARIPGGFSAWIGDTLDPFKAFFMALSFAKDLNYGDET